MAIRIRTDGCIICAAMSKLEEGDIYVEDRLHYELAVELCLMVADPNHKTNGLWHWSFPQSS